LLVIGASAAGSASSFLLVFKRLGFTVSTGISVGAMAVQAIWFLLANRALYMAGGYPQDLAKLGQSIGGALVAALPVAGFAVVGRAPTWFRWGIGGAGLAVGSVAWIAWPYWYFLAARHLSHVPDAAGNPGRRPVSRLFSGPR